MFEGVKIADRLLSVTDRALIMPHGRPEFVRFLSAICKITPPIDSVVLGVISKPRVFTSGARDLPLRGLFLAQTDDHHYGFPW